MLFNIRSQYLVVVAAAVHHYMEALRLEDQALDCGHQIVQQI